MNDNATYEATRSGALEDGATVAGGTASDTRVAGLLPREASASSPAAGATGHGAATDAITFLGGIGLGAALMYFMDPERGRRRRALVRDQLAHVKAVAPGAARTAGRDIANRSRGVVAQLRGRFQDDTATDETIVARVRSELGRVVSHPSSIIVTAQDGSVTISGPVLDTEVDRLMTTVAGVRGVKEVRSQLEVHDVIDSMSVPGLQGGLERTGARWELAQNNWTPAARVMATAAGTTLALMASRRKDTIGSIVGLLGLGLTARAVLNEPIERSLMDAVRQSPSRARDLATGAASRVRDGASAAAGRVRDGATATASRVRDGASTVAERTTELAGSAKDHVADLVPEAVRNRMAGDGAGTDGGESMGETIDRDAVNPRPNPETDRPFGT